MLARYGGTLDFAAHVQEMLEVIPESLQEFLAKNDVSIIPVKDIGTLRPEFAGASGLYTVEKGRPYIFLSEDAHKLAGAIDAGKLELTIRHETVHAVDGLMNAKRWVSDIALFKNTFESEFAALDPGFKTFLLIGIGRGSADILRKEVVAELVSRYAIPGVSAEDKFYAGCFPKLAKILNDACSPFAVCH